MRSVADELVALQRGGHAIATVVAHHFAHAAKPHRALGGPRHGQRDEVFNDLAHRDGNVRNKQDSIGTHVPGLGNAGFWGGARSDQLDRQLEIESDSFSLVRHVKLTVLDLGSKVNTSESPKVPVRRVSSRVWEERGCGADDKNLDTNVVETYNTVLHQ